MKHVLHETENWSTQNMWYWLVICLQKPPNLQLSPTSYHTISITLSPLTIFIPPPPHLCSSASTSSLPLSSCYRLCPPTCLPVLVQPPLSASVNVFCPYKERAQADCTNRVSSAGVLQGQGDHSECNGGVRWEEDGGERIEGMGEGGGCRATVLLSMTPNKMTEIGTGEEEVGGGRMARRGRWMCLRGDVAMRRSILQPHLPFMSKRQSWTPPHWWYTFTKLSFPPFWRCE